MRSAGQIKLPVPVLLTLILMVLLVCVLYSNWQLLAVENENLVQLRKTHKLLARLEKKIEKGELVAAGANDARASLGSLMTDLDGSINLRTLRDGMYKVNAPVVLATQADGKARKHTIYHFKMTIQPGRKKQAFHFGLALSGIVNRPKLYVDYDSDGRVDVEMMHELVQWLPFQKLFSKSVRPDVAQAAYNAFLGSIQSSKYSDISGIATNGDALVRGVWEAISDRASDISEMVQDVTSESIERNVRVLEDSLPAEETFSLDDLEEELRRGSSSLLDLAK